jgi:O-antigen ligase
MAETHGAVTAEPAVRSSREPPSRARPAEGDLPRAKALLDAYLHEAAFAGLGVGIALAPFWFGGNRPIVWSLSAAYFGSLTLVYELGLAASAREHPIALKRIGYPALAFAATALWLVLQMSALTPADYHQPIWQMASEALGRAIPGAISLDRDETYWALVRLMTLGLAFWLALQTGRSPERAKRAVALIAALGAAYAAYGIVALFVFPRTTLWFDKLSYLDSVTSTFVNRNSYATYAGIGLIAALTLSFGAYAEASRRHGDGLRTLASFVAASVGTGGAWLAAAVVIGVALILTGSRGGVSASLFGLLAFAILAAARGRKRGLGAGVGLLVGLLAVALAFFAFGDFFAERVAEQGFNSDDRLSAYRLTWLSIEDSPWLGFGYGTFRQVFSMYRDSSIGPFGVWDLAHDSYLELLQGLGAPMAMVFLSAIAVLIARCAYGALTRGRSASAAVAAVAATMIVMLHSFVDFSMQMQGVALTWTALVGFGVAQSWGSRVSTSG